ncbi:hypothetical protein LINPERPRIM_LOCUS1933 [Linum perenne]
MRIRRGEKVVFFFNITKQDAVRQRLEPCRSSFRHARQHYDVVSGGLEVCSEVVHGVYDRGAVPEPT